MNFYKFSFLVFYSLMVMTLGISCISIKNQHYSYTLNLYRLDTSKKLLSVSHLISYGNYLLEFRLRTINNSTQHGEFGNKITVTTYDTIGVYLLQNNSKIYYEFDSFYLETKIIKAGNITEKEFGRHFSEETYATNNDDSSLFDTPIKCKINNIECYTTAIKSKFPGTDSIEFKLILIKYRNFNSFYKINGIEYKDKEYCIIGTLLFHKLKKEGFAEEITNLRLLTNIERKICDNMIKKSKTYSSP